MSSSSEETHDNDDQVRFCKAPTAVLVDNTRADLLTVLCLTAQARTAPLINRHEQVTAKDNSTPSQESTEAGSKPSCGMF